jgi:hypothetical protein
MFLLEIAAWLAWLTHGLAARGLRTTQALAFGLVVLATTWPVYYLLDTANIEGLLLILVGVGVLAVLRGRNWTGAALIGLAASMKYYPLALLALLFSKRRYREFVFGLAVMVGVTVAGLACVGPSIRVAQTNIDQALLYVRNVYITAHHALQLNFSHALFNPVKFAVLLVYRVLVCRVGIGGRGPQEDALVDTTLHVYLYATAVFGLALYFWRIRKLPMLNQTICLTVCAITLTPFSSDYTLDHLLVPFALLCFYAMNTRHDTRHVPGLDACFALLCLILGFATFFTWKYAFAPTVRCAALLALLAIAMRYPFPWAQLDERAA